MLYTQEYFSDIGCMNENCKDHDNHEFYLHSRCHITVPTWVYINTENPTEAVIICSECKTEVGRIAIARAEDL